MKRCIFACLTVGLLVLATACSTKKDTAEQPPADDVYMGDTATGDAPPADQVDQDILADDYGAGADAGAGAGAGTADLPPEATTPAQPALSPTQYMNPPGVTTPSGYVSPLPPVSEGYPDYSGAARSTGKSYTTTSGSYVVKRGDSLWSISRRHGTTVNALAAANNISTTAIIREGQRLTIPGGAAASSSSGAASDSGSGRTYNVQPGDSYYTIGRKFGVSTQKLMNHNGATSSTLRAGQTIRIP